MEGMTNLVTITGRLGQNPRSNVSDNGRQLFFPIASTSARGETTWIDVAVFDRFEEASQIAYELKKGDLVTIYGTLNARMDSVLIHDPETRQGKSENRRKHSIIATDIEKEEDNTREATESAKELLMARLVPAR